MIDNETERDAALAQVKVLRDALKQASRLVCRLCGYLQPEPSVTQVHAPACAATEPKLSEHQAKQAALIGTLTREAPPDGPGIDPDFDTEPKP